MTAPRLALHVSRSSAPKRWDLSMFVDAAKIVGFVGVEMSLVDLGCDIIEQRQSADFIQTCGLHLIVDVDSSLQPHTRTRSDATLTPSDHLRAFESQLNTISSLGKVVSHINCYSGCNFWDEATSAEYLADVLPLSAQFLEENSHIGRFGREVDIMGGSPPHLTGISHETRGVLNHPDKTRRFLEMLPPIRLTADISHWHTVCGHQWGVQGNEEEAEALKVEIVPHIDHIRSVQTTSHVTTCNDEIKEVVLSPQYEDLWRYVWTRKAKRGVAEVTITPGHNISQKRHPTFDNYDGEKTLWIQTIEAANQIHQCFDTWSSKQ